MKSASLTEAEVKMAIREYVEKHKESFQIKCPWGLMECYVNDDIRIDNLIAEWHGNESNISDIKSAIDVLKSHNKWRRGDATIEPTDPTELGNAIDTLVDYVDNTLGLGA